MSKVMTFSRVYPAYHPKKGEDTFFVEAILNSLGIKFQSEQITPEVAVITNDFYLIDGSHKKGHTMRAGNRWKVGDKFSPRVWSGKPYQSKQIIIAPDIEVKKTWDVEMICDEDGNIDIRIDGEMYCEMGSQASVDIAENDGLEIDDFEAWFKLKPDEMFVGQIICWDESIEY